MKINFEKLKLKTDLPMSERIAIIYEVSQMTVSRYGYIPMLRKIYFDKAILEHCAGITQFSGNDFDIDEFCFFLMENRDDVDRIIQAVDPNGNLRDDCLAAVNYRVKHGTESAVDSLLAAVTRWIESAGSQKIDQETVRALIELIPSLKSMDTAEVAKAIIDRDPKIVSIGGVK